MGNEVGYGLAFVMGLVTSAHCVGMCGGFVMAYSARAAREGSFVTPHLWYVVGKIVSYAAVGGLLGLIGESLSFSPRVRIATAIAAGVILVTYGLANLGVMPLPRLMMSRVPPSIVRAISIVRNRGAHPLLVGLMSGLLIVCGPLQAMYIAAAGSGHAFSGALMLAFFGAGTLPLLLGFGAATRFLARRFTVYALRVAGVLIIALGALMINRGVVMARNPAADSCCHNPNAAAYTPDTTVPDDLVDP